MRIKHNIVAKWKHFILEGCIYFWLGMIHSELYWVLLHLESKERKLKIPGGQRSELKDLKSLDILIHFRQTQLEQN